MRELLRKKALGLIIFVSLMVAGLGYSAVSVLNQDVLKGYLANGAPFSFILIDIRSVDEIDSVIGNAQCKPYNLAWPEQFQKEVMRIPKDKKIIVYCRSGRRAAAAASFLNDNGFTSVLNAGGFMTWTGPVLPPSEIMPSSQLPEYSMRAPAR